MSKKELLASILERSGANALFRMSRSWDGLLVLNYHRVGDWPNTVWDRDLFSATQEEFREQLVFLKSNCDVIGADDISSVQNKRGRYVQITFDDGYKDNHDFAFPVLTDVGLSATFFICTGFIDQGGVPWWDELAWIVNHAPESAETIEFRGLGIQVPPTGARLNLTRKLNALYDSQTEDVREDFLEKLSVSLRSKRCGPQEAADLWMSWDMIRAMHRGGMTIGGHTLNHVELSRYDEAEQIREIAGSCERIQAEIGAPVRIFSYPYGTPYSFNKETRLALAKAGVEFAYSYSGGYQSMASWDKYDLKRTPVEAHHSKALFRSTVSVPQLFA